MKKVGDATVDLDGRVAESNGFVAAKDKYTQEDEIALTKSGAGR